MRKRICFITLLLCLLAAPVAAQRFVVNDIAISGNKITRLSVIMRELTFKQGDTISLNELAEHIDRTHSNLMNTSLFNYVYITDSLVNNDTAIDFHIKVEERWYIWPVVDLVFEDRNISTWIRHPDWSKFSFGAGVNIENMRGQNEKLHINARIGYQRGISIGYSNIAIDDDRKHLFGLSTSYNMVYNTAYETVDNKVQYVKINDSPIRECYAAGVSYSYRPGIRTLHTAALNFERKNISDTLLALNPNYWGCNNTSRNTLIATYAYTNDWRDSHSYPLSGTMWQIASNASMDLTDRFMGIAIYPELNTYWHFARRWFYAGEAKVKLSAASSESYIFQQALGYGSNYLRGYQDYVVDGQYFIYLKNTLRFLVMPTKTFEIKWLSALYKFNKIHFTIYANVFTDFGYAYNKYATPSNTFENSFLYSGGAGIDIVTYYDIAFRIDYAINKLGQGGFYITLITPFF